LKKNKQAVTNGNDFSSITTVEHCFSFQQLKQMQLKMTFAFHKVVRRHYSGKVGEFTIFWCEISSGFCIS